jgi:hypothetical protein
VARRRGNETAIVVAAALTAIAACVEAPRTHTGAQIIRAPGNGGMPRPCNGTDGASLARMNMDTYVVRIYDVVGVQSVPANATRAICQGCIADPSQCALEAPMCICGPSVAATPLNLAEQLRGTHSHDLDNVDLYCLQVLAVENGVLSLDRAAPCPCDPAWTEPAALLQSARLCAMSAPRAAGPLPIELDVVCPGDQRGGGGAGNFQSFEDCVAPTPPM